MTTNYMKVAIICNNARPNFHKSVLMYIEEAISKAIEDVDADELETIMDAFDNKTIADLGGVKNTADLVEHWKNKVMSSALTESARILAEVRIHNWNRKVRLDYEYFKEGKQI